ncbi:MAG: polysaccharide biosynthesis tyrosine autokinase [Acidobacteriaceae bacterium]|nr:polysaccharide biosynthesis tyrosine autokinase [Acidobacteriaceae bacterium]
MKQLQRSPSELVEGSRFSAFAQPASFLDFEAAQPTISAAHYFLVVFRQKWRILGFVATCLLATYLISSRLTPIYEATARIDVDRRVPSGIIGQEAAQAAASDDGDQFMATQMELIQSDAVLRPVAQHFNLLEREAQLDKLSGDKARQKVDAPTYLKQLKVTRPINTDILRISYRSPDPRLAADVANAIAQSYLEHTFDIRVRSSTALSSFMEKQLDELKAKMERSSLALAKFERELNVINPEEKTNILSARLLQLNTEYTNAQADRVRKEAAYNAMQGGSIAAAQVSVQGQDLSKLYERLNQAKQHFADTATVYGANHSEYRKAANDLAEVQRQFEEMKRNVAERIETDYREAVTREQMLQRAVAQTKGEYDQLNSRSFEYQQLKRDADADKTLYSDLERRIREAGINAGFQNSSIRIADLARPPDKAVFPKKALNLLLAFIISSVLAVCGAILADVLDTTVRDPEQAARALETSVVGTLPTVREMRRLIGPMALASGSSGVEANGNDPSGGMGLVRYGANGDPRAPREQKNARKSSRSGSGYAYDGISSYEEAIRTLRHSIFLPDLERNVRSLLLTSAAPGEGKSTATIHLGIAHSEQGKRTLIIDADLRRPSIHKKLGLNGGAGLSNVLLGELNWRDALVRTAHWPELDVLPAGTLSRRASDLVGSMMVDILDDAAHEYDLILVDAPPLLGFAEAMQVATAVDGVVVLARAGETSRKAVARALAILNRLRANVIGLVLNEVDKNNSHGYYYHYSDYRKYYADSAQKN